LQPAPGRSLQPSSGLPLAPGELRRRAIQEARYLVAAALTDLALPKAARTVRTGGEPVGPAARNPVSFTLAMIWVKVGG
jgi:hypothetical protein